MNGKSKLVVPVIAIMMCAVALAGVAYAYTSSVTNDGPNIDPDYEALLFTDSGGTEITGAFTDAAKGIVVTTNTNYVTPLVGITFNGSATVTVYFKLMTDKATAPYAVTGDLVLKKAGATTTTVDVESADTGHKTITFAVGNIAITNVDGSAVQGNLAAGTVYKATFSITASGDVQFSNRTAAVDAAAVVDAMDDLTYTVTLTAEDA